MKHARMVRRGEALVRTHFSRPGTLQAFRVFLALVEARDRPDDPGRLARLAQAIEQVERRRRGPMEALGRDRSMVGSGTARVRRRHPAT